jgi:D-beta-D-heptose 7-phosphate kinase/D-beta-D-heptose 1-phosphate adenosyltransferase
MNKILLIGDNCIDLYIYGDCYRLNPEAPTPVLNETHRIQFNGMAGNVLKNIQALGLNADFLTHKEEIIKTRYVDKKSNYVLLRIDNDNSVTRICDMSKFDFSKYDLTIVSDYDKGFIKIEDLEIIFEKSKLSFIDTKKPVDKWIKNVTFIKINEAEFANPKNNLDFMSSELNEKLIVTLGELGTKYKGKLYKPPKEVLVRDVAGAGDSFLASLSCHYLLHKNIEEAINFANLCAGQVVSKKGIAFPDEKLL